jgi:ABC transporter substrate binding protein
MDLRWAGGDTNRMQALAQELVGLQPDIILTGGTEATIALQRETRTIPIVFAAVGDPAGSSIVARLDRPGGNTTGFAFLEASRGGKWLALLSEIAPGLKRAAIMFDPDASPASAYMSSLETAAQSLKIVPTIAPVHSDVQIETATIDLGREAALSSCRIFSWSRIAARSGVGGAKGRDQGECGPAKHVPDSEPDAPDAVPAKRVTGAGTHTARGERSPGRHSPEVGEAMGRAAEVWHLHRPYQDGGCPVVQVNDLSRSLAAFDALSTLVVVVEMSKASWLVTSIVPGIERQPLKKLEPDATALLRLIERWRNEGRRQQAGAISRCKSGPGNA